MSKSRQKANQATESAIVLATEVSRYVMNHPSVRDCLLEGVINISALSRKIFEQLPRRREVTEVAVQKALQRYLHRMKPDTPQNQQQVLKIVRGVRVRVKTEMAVVLVSSSDEVELIQGLQRRIVADRGEFQAIEGDGFVVLIVHEDSLPVVNKTLRTKIRSITKRLAELHLIFDRKIEVTSGVVSFVYNRLAERGINIREEMSCWTDVKLLIDERDLAKALQVLDFDG